VKCKSLLLSDRACKVDYGFIDKPPVKTNDGTSSSNDKSACYTNGGFAGSTSLDFGAAGLTVLGVYAFLM